MASLPYSGGKATGATLLPIKADTEAGVSHTRERSPALLIAAGAAFGKSLPGLLNKEGGSSEVPFISLLTLKL